jgi:hypothetical protein
MEQLLTRPITAGRIPLAPPMTDTPVKLTIAFTDPQLNPEEQEAAAQQLLGQLADLDTVKTDRVLDPHPPAGNKAVGSILFGWLTAEVSKESFKQLTAFLSQRLGEKGPVIKLKVKAPDGRELDIEANDQATFDHAMQKAQDFIHGTGAEMPA